MDSTRYLGVAFAAFFLFTALALFFYNLARPRPQPMMTGANRIAPYLAMIGVIGFTTGLGLLFYNPKQTRIGLLLAGAGWLGILGSILINAATAKSRRSAWPVVPARCTEQVLNPVMVDSRKAWSWQITCEVEHDGKKYQLSPRVCWSDLAQTESSFRKEAKARRYLAQRVAADGRCRLRINPANPREAKLVN